jgi:hypothetical protein
MRAQWSHKKANEKMSVFGPKKNLKKGTKLMYRRKKCYQ